MNYYIMVVSASSSIFVSEYSPRERLSIDHGCRSCCYLVGEPESIIRNVTQWVFKVFKFLRYNCLQVWNTLSLKIKKENNLKPLWKTDEEGSLVEVL